MYDLFHNFKLPTHEGGGDRHTHTANNWVSHGAMAVHLDACFPPGRPKATLLTRISLYRAPPRQLRMLVWF
jgi:hypothetical protein